MSTNKHIIDNLEYYLKLDCPEYAFMITGDWGSGKTHFIDSFINGYECTDRKILKISLFGLSSTSQIDQKIFEELHPILGSKYARAAGTLIKGALSLGVRLDLNSDGSQETTANTKFDKFNLSDFLPNSSKEPIELIIALDDLERTSIPLKDVLGYINCLVEISKIKAIILANEKFIFDGADRALYESFKEKVIGKTFEVKHSINDLLESILKDRKFIDFDSHSEIIKDVYLRSKFNNLRNVKQSIDDFEFLAFYIEKKYLANADFYCSLLRDFISLSLEIKKGSLREDNLLKNTPFRQNSDSDTEENSIYKKYFSDRTPVFNGRLWSSIIFKGDISGVNEAISKLAYFLEKEEVKNPDWVRLWDFRLLEDNEFKCLLDKLEYEIKSLVENDLRIYFHKLALMIFFSKNHLTAISISDIKDSVHRYVDKYRFSDLWRDSIVTIDSYFNGTGYAYLNYEDPDFIDLKKYITDANRSAYDQEQHGKRLRILNEFVESLESGEIEYFNTFLLDTYELTPILHEVEASKVAAALRASKNKVITEFCRAINSRYSRTHFINDIPKYALFKKELEFWEDLKKNFHQDIGAPGSIKTLLLKSFLESTVITTIDLLSKE